MKKLSVGEETMAQHLRAEKIPFQREVKLIPGRKSKVDFLLPHNVILEVEGGTRSFGRHSRHNGFQEDCRKYNELTTLGYKVYRFTTEMAVSGEALYAAKRAITTHCRPMPAEGIPPAYTARSTHSHANVEELGS
jgi:very-short-patch-repair endonuclease